MLPLESVGLTGINPQNPWVAAVQLDHAWQLYSPEVAAVLGWLVPVVAAMWVVISGLGRSLVLWKLASASGHRRRMRPMGMMVLQAAWLVSDGRDGGCMGLGDGVGGGNAHRGEQFGGWRAGPGWLFDVGDLFYAGRLIRRGRW